MQLKRYQIGMNKNYKVTYFIDGNNGQLFPSNQL